MPFANGKGIILIIFTGCILSLCQGFLDSPSVSVRAGDQAVLKCSITTRVPRWTSPSGGLINNYDFLFLSPSNPYRDRMSIAANGNLVINSTQQYDKGNYVCFYPGSGSDTVHLEVLDPLSTTTTGTSIRTECCICDDNSPDESEHCSKPHVCAGSFTSCEYCETERKYTGTEWKTARRCGFKDSCITKLYQTAAEPGCNHGPTQDISCYTCCKTVDKKHPFNCVSNPDSNQLDFELTTLYTSTSSSNTPTKTTVPMSSSVVSLMTSTASNIITTPSTIRSVTYRSQTSKMYTTFSTQPGVVSSVSQVKTIYVQAGEQAILKCSITTKIPKWSSPSGELINYYDSTLVHPFHPDRDRLSVGGNGYLIINNTQLYDKGEYICSDRTNGSERISLVVGVHTSTSSSNTPAKTTVPMSSSVISLMTSTTSNIKITPSTIRSVTSRSQTPTVYTTFSTQPGVVSSVSQVKTIYVHAGEQAILKCSITSKIPKWSSPSGELINYYDSTLIHPFYPDRERLSVGGNGYLIINNTKLYDKGEYICSDRTNGSERISLVVGAATPPKTTTRPSSTTTLHTTKSTSDRQSTLQKTLTSKATTTYTIKSFYSTLSTTDVSTDKTTNTFTSGLPSGMSTTMKAGIDGAWSEWSSWYGCTSKCEGVRVRIRSCTNPLPSGSGEKCSGLAVEEEICQPSNCKVATSSASTVTTSTTTSTATSVSPPKETFKTTISAFETRAPSTNLPTTTGSTAREAFTSIQKSETFSSRPVITTLDHKSNSYSSINAVTNISTTKSSNLTASPKSAGHLVAHNSTTISFSKVSYTSKSGGGAFTKAPPPPVTSKSEPHTSSTKFGPSSTLTFLNSSITSKSLQTSIQRFSTPTIGNTTTIPAPATRKSLVTIPPVATQCAVCAGPPEACELAFYEDYCQPPHHYCINHIINRQDGSRLVERKCGDINTCYNDWYLGSSDDDKCRMLSSKFILTYHFECTYCCVKDGCNIDLHPKEDTLYSNT